MEKVIEQKKYLVRRFHILLSRMGFDSEIKLTLLERYGVDSSLKLSVNELIELNRNLEKMVAPHVVEMDKWRKRLIAAVSGYLKLLHKDSDIYAAKSVACRASGCRSFNKIPRQRLINLYSAFVNKQKDLNSVNCMSGDDIRFLEMCN